MKEIEDIKKAKINLSIGYEGLMALINNNNEYIQQLIEYIKCYASSALEMPIAVNAEITYDT